MSDKNSEKESILNEVLNLLSEKYPSGLYDWLYKYRPEAYREINELEERINSNFLNGGSVEGLKTILRSYWITHMRAIKDFQEYGQSDSSLDKIRAERIQGLETLHP